MKKSITQTALGLIALATMSFAASNAQANHDHPQRFDQHYGQSWQGRGDYAPRQGQRVSQQRMAEINAREAQLLNRVERGIRDGSLTRRESRTLRSELRYFETAKRNALSDGFLSPYEFRQLNNGLDTSARNIRMQRHDDDTRTSHYNTARYGHQGGYNR